MAENQQMAIVSLDQIEYNGAKGDIESNVIE